MPKSNRPIIAITISLVILAAAVAVLVIYQSAPTSSDTLFHDPDWPQTAEYTPVTIPLAGPVADADAEISGLAWYNDYLILLPQYPQRFDNQLYALPKEAILAVLDGQSAAPLTPQAIPFIAADLYQLDGFEGVEAIAFVDDQVFLTIESSPGTAMLGYLVSGQITPDLSQITIETTTLAAVEPQTDVTNYSEETVLIADDTVITLYEANGRNLNTAPVAHRFDKALTPLSTIPFPTIEYRITDATDVDENGRFWAINYVPAVSIEKLNPAADDLFATYGIGPTHSQNNVVERLVEFQYSDSGISFTSTPPQQLTLLGDDEARNWEGIVRLEDRGFLLATDKFPDTILAFVPLP